MPVKIDYKNIDLMLELSNKYDYKYYYIGYKKLNKQEKIIYIYTILKISNNVSSYRN